MTTRLWLLSDLHVDASPWTPPAVPPCDVVVVAGDVADDLNRRGIPWLVEHLVPTGLPIVYVPGNHEFYRTRWETALARARVTAAEAGIHLLANGEALEIAGARFIGATLWTDYCVGPLPRSAVLEACGARVGGMRDHRRIQRRNGSGQVCAFRPVDAAIEHVLQRIRIERLLAQPFAGPNVVVTHHAPHAASLRHGEWREATDGAYGSDLSEILVGPHAPRLWLHGHVHRPIHHWVMATEVVANPRGIISAFRDRRGIERTEVENPGFLPSLVLEI